MSKQGTTTPPVDERLHESLEEDLLELAEQLLAVLARWSQGDAIADAAQGALCDAAQALRADLRGLLGLIDEPGDAPG